MKKVFLISAFALLAAGCTSTVNTDPNANNNNPPIQPPQQTQPTTQTYKNSTYSFQFQYPADMAFVTPNYALLNDKVTELQIPKTDYPNTNFGDAAFSVSASYAKTLASCLAMNPPENGDGFKTTVQINGVTFYTTSGAGAGAGNRYDTKTYRTLVGAQSCIELNETVHTSAIGNYPAGTVTAVDINAVQSRLDQVLNTFKFN
ncbi:MAG: hypothetical protein JWO40_121 [Candidatus Doudnabacteria bacterium]|nr:hypothetical protein [Candidatus Doudnabacteria bacterium]